MVIDNVPLKTVYKVNHGLQAIVRRNRSGQRTNPEKPDRLRVPYLSLMHARRAIRYEFRSLYFNQIAVPIGSRPSFIFAFIEHPQLPMKIAFYTFWQSVRTLRVVVAPCDALELLPLLRLKARRSTCKVEIQSEKGREKRAAALAHLINNTNEMWLRWISTRVVRETELTIFPGSRDDMTFHVTLLTQLIGTGEVWDFMNRLDCDKRIGLRCPGLSVRFHRIDY
jgi:hypothetical protein